jgi:hypothetical protein
MNSTTMTTTDYTDPHPIYVPAATIAEMLCCHTKTVHRLAARGEIPAPIDLGGLRRWHLASVLASLGK